MTSAGSAGRCSAVIDAPPAAAVARSVALALAEDRAFDDVSTLNSVPADLFGTAKLLGKDNGVLGGALTVAEAFAQVDPRIRIDWHVHDGEWFEGGAVLAEISGPVQGLLQAERVALNFVQRLSGVATLTRQFVDAVAGTKAVILDTRKTTPGLRDLEKYAVRCGGGTNHRRDLASMVMLKDNHLQAAARASTSLADIAATIRAKHPGMGIEIEIDRLSQLDAALAANPEWVLLDNMAPDLMAEAVKRTAGRARLEASGGINLGTVRAAAESGVDAVSVGALTHSAPSLDISLDLEF